MYEEDVGLVEGETRDVWQGTTCSKDEMASVRRVREGEADSCTLVWVRTECLIRTGYAHARHSSYSASPSSLIVLSPGRTTLCLVSRGRKT